MNDTEPVNRGPSQQHIQFRHRTNNRACTERISDESREFFSAINRASTSPLSLVLAVSGGPDSLCMAHVLITLRHELNIEPVIAHLDHQIRGDAARADAVFVREFAVQHETACIIEEVDVPSIARSRHQSIEAAARTVRYRFLASVAKSIGTEYVALAHNADDQAETVLLRLIRGTGIRGLRGMLPVASLPYANHCEKAVLLLRPLLAITRREVECYCRENGLSPRHDVTNDELHHTRNRIRHELLPTMEHINPGIRKVLARLAITASSDIDVVDYATQQIFNDLQLSAQGDMLMLDRDKWRALPVGLQRATLREGVLRVKHDPTDLKYRGIEEARIVINSHARSAEIAILADIRIIVNPESFTFVLHTL